jgi:hypothetical protein
VAGLSRADLLARGGRGTALLAAGSALGFVGRSDEATALKQLAARAAASDAQHLSVFAAEIGGRRIGDAFPRPLSIDRVSNTLDTYTS